MVQLEDSRKLAQCLHGKERELSSVEEELHGSSTSAGGINCCNTT